MTRTPVELALEYFECQNRKDVKGIETLLHPDFQANTPWGPKSRADALKAWDQVMNALPPSTLKVVNVEEISHGSVLIEIVMHFTPDPSDPRGDLRVPTCDVIKTRDGKMLSLRAYFNRTAVDQYLAAGKG